MPPDTIFRPLQGDRDIEAICNIIHGCEDVDQIDPYSTLEKLPSLETIQSDFANTDPRNAIIVELKGKPVGYNRIIWWAEAGDLILYLHLGRVLPEFRGRGIGTSLLGWSEARIRELAAEHGGQAMFGANASSTEKDATDLLHHNGYQSVFSLVQMEYLIPEDLRTIPTPSDIEIRPPEPADAAKMWRARRAAYSDVPLAGIPMSDEESEIGELRNAIEETGHLWRIAWSGDSIASEIWCSISNYKGSKTGSLDEVHTVPQFQWKGIGRALMNQVLLMFKQMDVSRVRLHTMDDNRRGAKTFYEKIGFRTIKTFPRYRKPLILKA